MTAFGALLLFTSSAFAGLFSDTEARQNINQLTARLTSTETTVAKLEADLAKLAASSKQQLDALNMKNINALLDLQNSIDALNAELRKIRGQNEELQHGLQAAEKRQQDFYIDLDARLRRIEAAASSAEHPKAATIPLTESMALDDALAFYKTEQYAQAVIAFQGFLKAYPKSERVADVHYWAGNSYFLLKDYAHSLENYKIIADKFANYLHLPEVLLNIADCQDMLSDTAGAKATLQSIQVRFPNTDAADKAKKLLLTY